MRRHRKKIYRLRGKRTHGGGCSKNRRGRGSRMTNRRTFGSSFMHTVKYEPWRMRIRGFSTIHPKQKGINLRDVEQLSKENEIDVTAFGYGRVLGKGDLSKPVTLKARHFTKTALEKIEKAGGKAIVIGAEEKTPAEDKSKSKEEKE